MKFKTLPYILGLFILSNAASALTYYPTTKFQDDDVEQWIDTNSNGTLDIGDRFVTVIEIGNTEDVFSSATSSIGPAQELSGISDITIVAGTGTLLDPWLFGGSGAAGYLSSYAAGTMAAFFLDATDNISLTGNTNCASVAACISAAINGNIPYLTAGLTSAADGIWSAQALTVGAYTPSTLTSVPSSTNVAAVNYALSIIVNNTGKTFKSVACPVCGDGFADMVGSGTVQGGQGLTNGFQARSDFDFQVEVIPEPEIIALLGIGLLGLGLTTRRRVV